MAALISRSQLGLPQRLRRQREGHHLDLDRVIAQSKKVDDATVDLLASDLATRIQNEMDYPGKIKVTVIRELRAVDYAH